MAIDTKLQALLDARSTLAANLRGVGVAASDTETLTQLAAKVADADEWHPNPYWPSLDDIADGQIGFIVRDRDAVGLAARFCFIVSSTANFTIDWGDGTVETLASGAIADHTYVIGGGVSDGRGTTVYKARISSTGNILIFTSQVVRNYRRVRSSLLYCNFRASQVTSLVSSFYACELLESVLFSTLNAATSLMSAFYYCSLLKKIILPSLPLVTTFSSAFYYCSSLRTLTVPSMPSCTGMSQSFYGSTNLESLTIGDLPRVTNLFYCFAFCSSLKYLSIGSMPKVTNAGGMMSQMFTSSIISLPDDFASLSTGVDGSLMLSSNSAVIDASFPNAKFTKISTAGYSATFPSGIKSLTFHPSSTFSNNAPHIDISYCDFTRQSLVNLFNLLPTLTGKQVKITGCTGAAELTAGDREIATRKGWTIVE